MAAYRSGLAGAQVVAVDPPLGAEHAHDQLFFGHFQTKNSHRPANMNTDMLRNIKTKGRFAHARPTGNNDQIGGLKTRRQTVKIGKTGWYTGNQLFAFVKLFDMRDIFELWLQAPLPLV